ncbi:hypothetical protein PoB_004503500 [Plakobranchus ocellatus]|uniref:Uncharacterized protein n=1 Tax=Plakobranchus ocellatus TaxID=259542 RepID=A0AAV4BG67_9GAST|nr:hypothetical protein PoB_004503500 [Plakobranchus ocellatus]
MCLELNWVRDAPRSSGGTVASALVIRSIATYKVRKRLRSPRMQWINPYNSLSTPPFSQNCRLSITTAEIMRPKSGSLIGPSVLIEPGAHLRFADIGNQSGFCQTLSFFCHVFLAFTSVPGFARSEKRIESHRRRRLPPDFDTGEAEVIEMVMSHWFLGFGLQFRFVV